MRKIFTDKAPTPAGHYSQATGFNELLFISGQLPIDPETGEKKLGEIEQQTEQALANLAGVLEAAGSDLNHVLKTTVYISDMELWPRVNAVYAGFFGRHKPARSVVPTLALHYGFKIEIEAIAVLNNN